MDVEQIQVTKEEVEQELKDLEQAIEKGYISKKNRMVQDLLQVYGHLKHSGEIIDVPKAFSKAGLDSNTDPKLAIIRADARICYLYKFNHGGALFHKEMRSWRQQHSVRKADGDIRLPNGTFTWEKLEREERFRQTPVPLIPPRVSLAVSCRIIPQHYYIIFEPESWNKYEPLPPRDPILGKMLTDNLFGVLATWELTELEAKIVEGRI